MCWLPIRHVDKDQDIDIITEQKELPRQTTAYLTESLKDSRNAESRLGNPPELCL